MLFSLIIIVEYLLNLFSTGVMKIIDPISSIVMAIASVANLIIVLFIFKQQKDEKRTERDLESKSFWFREVFLKQNLHLIDNSFEIFKTFLERNYDDDQNLMLQDSSRISNEFLDLSIALKSSEIFNKKLQKNIENVLEDTEDDISELIFNTNEDDDVRLRSFKLSQFKNNIYAVIYSYNNETQ